MTGTAMAVIGCLALAACGEKATDNDSKTTVKMDAIDVAEGTISDTLMPLDTREGLAAGNSQAATDASAAGSASAGASDDSDKPADDTETSADNEDDSKQ